ncbi:MAG: DAK2 domain-containing protein, partial [Nitrosomonas sp.]|nr:DAK2 domain-containing protein [Nitrosomonas sp.]
DSGKTLDEVFHIAQQANQRVRTLGVAFSGCTLPGANKPLFEVVDGKMEVGMGIHGESGLQQMATPTADKLAEILVSRLLSEVPSTIANPDGARVGVILNSLGAVKQEELFVVYRKVSQLLSEHGLIIVEPVVGEFITSFDMAGVSLTLFWMNDALEQSWIAAADAPGFHRGHVAPPDGDHTDAAQSIRKHSIATGSVDSQAAAAVVLAALEAALDEVDVQKDELGRLDAVAGDGDHGMGMHRGLTAAVAAAKEMLVASAGVGSVLTSAGDAWSDQAGGTSGALWGVILRSFGQAFGDDARPDTATVVAGVATALREVQRLGKAQLGDKTLVDVLHPFSEALANGLSCGLSISDAWTAATKTANEAAQATQNLLPKIGRARPHAEKSKGTPDPGAVSMALIIGSVDLVVRERCC